MKNTTIEDKPCVNCKRPTHPYCIKRYHGYCLECSNAGAEEKDAEIAKLKAEIEELKRIVARQQ